MHFYFLFLRRSISGVFAPDSGPSDASLQSARALSIELVIPMLILWFDSVVVLNMVGQEMILAVLQRAQLALEHFVRFIDMRFIMLNENLTSGKLFVAHLTLIRVHPGMADLVLVQLSGRTELG